MALKISKKCYFRLLFFIFLSVWLTACNQYTDLSTEQPYAEAIGKNFVLQQDYYIFKFTDNNEVVIGKANQLPKLISQKYIGFKSGNLTIVGIAKSGQLFLIEKIIEKKTLEDYYYNYYILLSSLNSSQIYEINASLLCNALHNPPFTKTWSDPPIFDPKAALPLPSDGIWWK